MSNTVALQGPEDEPKVESIQVEIARLRIVFDLSSENTNGHLSNEELENFKEVLLKPCFARAQNEILNKFGDRVEVSSIRLRNGSIWVDAGVYFLTVAQNPLAVGALASILAGIVLKRIYSPNSRKEHQKLMDKISAILESHTRDIAGQDFCIEDNHFPIFDPKLKGFKITKFTFHSKRIERLQRDVQKAIENYHTKIGE